MVKSAPPSSSRFGNYIFEIGCTDGYIHKKTSQYMQDFLGFFNSVLVFVFCCAHSVLCQRGALPLLSCLLRLGVCELSCHGDGKLLLCFLYGRYHQLTTYFSLLASEFTYGQFEITRFFGGKVPFPYTNFDTIKDYRRTI